MITVKDLFDKPKIIIFSEQGQDDFYEHCKQREIGIKEAFDTSFKTFNNLLKKFEEKKDVFTKWEKEKVTSCAHNIGDYMEYLLEELDKVKIESYCSLKNSKGEKLIPFLPDMILMLTNSFQGAVETDLHWVTDLTIADTIDISIGDFEFNKLLKYLPSRIVEVLKLCQELKEIDYIKKHLSSIEEAITCYETNHLKASNLLLLTIIEGLVRSLGIYLVEKQMLTVNPLNKRKYASLERFLNDIHWKKDLSISAIKYGLITGSYSVYKPNEPDFVTVNLTERLGFLCRRFKENRNVILHGEETQYANALNSFLNFSALKEVLLTVESYQSIYAD